MNDHLARAICSCVGSLVASTIKSSLEPDRESEFWDRYVAVRKAAWELDGPRRKEECRKRFDALLAFPVEAPSYIFQALLAAKIRCSEQEFLAVCDLIVCWLTHLIKLEGFEPSEELLKITHEHAENFAKEIFAKEGALLSQR